jgi:hypothetical protein
MPTPVKGVEAGKIRTRLTAERAKLEVLSANAATSRSRSESVTPGGLTDYDPAVLSGLTRSRRKATKSAERRFAAYDAEAAASRELTEQEALVGRLERQLEQAEADAKAPCDLSSLAPGSYVRDRWGWHRVVRVSKKSVSVETGYTWTDRIALDRLIEIRQPTA